MVQVRQGEKGHGAALIAQRVAEGGAGGEQRAGWELLQQHLHPQTSPQFSNHESQGAICDMCRECGATC